MSNKPNRAATLLFSLAAFLAMILPLVVYIYFRSEDPPLWPYVLVLSVFLLSFIVALIAGIKEVIASIEFRREVFRMEYNQIDAVIELSKTLLPETPIKKDLKRVYRSNNRIIRVQVKIRSFLGLNFSKICGFCSLLPLTKEAANLVHTENLLGLRFTPDHILSSHKDAQFLYLGSIAAIGLRDRREMIFYVKGAIDQAFERGVKAIYTRPTTRQGLKLAQRFEFEPVCEDVDEAQLNRIYILENL